MRIAITLLAAFVLAGCGESNEQPLDAADINRNNHAEEAIFLQRVLGDDAISERSISHVRAAPFAALADQTLTPGGFGGNDNERRYLMRRDGISVTLAESDLPRSLRPLISDLNTAPARDRARRARAGSPPDRSRSRD